MTSRVIQAVGLMVKIPAVCGLLLIGRRWGIRDGSPDFDMHRHLFYLIFT